MSIHKRERKKGIVYLAVIPTIMGKQITKTFRRKIDAEMWEREQLQLFRSDPQKILTFERSNMPLAEFCQLWLTKYAEIRKAASSVRRDKQIINFHIVPYLGKIRLVDLTHEHVEFWFNDLGASKQSPKSCNHHLGLLKKILNDAVAWRYVSRNEAKHVKALKLQKTEPKFWTREESVKFLTYIQDTRPEWFPVFAIALYTGMRKGEIRALKWDCVDLERKVIVVKRTYCEIQQKIVERTKGKTDRWIPINESLMQVLIAQRNKDTELVITGYPFAHSSRHMSGLCKKVGISVIRFHDLRHTFASNLVMSGKPLYEVQKLLGHANYSMTERYAHLSPEYLKGATDSLDFSPKEGAKILKMVR